MKPVSWTWIAMSLLQIMIKRMIQTNAPRAISSATLPEKPTSTPFVICIGVGSVIHVVNYMFSCFCSIEHDVVKYATISEYQLFGSPSLLLFCWMFIFYKLYLHWFKHTGFLQDFYIWCTYRIGIRLQGSRNCQLC